MIYSVFKVCIYFMIVLITYLVVNNCYRYNRSVRMGSVVVRQSNYNITYLAIIFCSVILAIYSACITSSVYDADRAGYTYRYVNHIDSYFLKNSYGLYILVRILWCFSDNPSWLYFTVTFISVFITLLALKISEIDDPFPYLLMGFSLYNVYSFYLFKQAPAIAFSSLAFALFLKKKKIFCLITIILAISFHETAFILIPLFVVLTGAKRKSVRVVSYIFLGVSLLFFSSASSTIVSIFFKIIPSLSTQLRIYLNDSGAIETNSNFLTIIKGLPYYLITIYALKYRKTCSTRIKNFDRYFTMSVFASVLTLMSGYMYWMWRFAAFAYFPQFVFVAQLCKETKNINPKESNLFKVCLCFLFLFFTGRYLLQVFIKNGGF